MKNKLTLIFIISFISTISIGQPISEKFPFESRFISLDGDKIHYIDEGSGDPILFLHGVPMSIYSWRNIIPHLSDTARCIAIDFMGFGKSDKPDIAYTFDDQMKYLTLFIETMQLDNITLVMTDIGGILGMRYASLYPSKIKGLVLMETPIADATTFHKNGGMMQHMMFNLSGKDKMGYRMIVKKNMFLKMMPMLIKRKLSRHEKDTYKEPFKNVEARKPLFILPNSFPKKGKNPQEGDMADYLNKNNDWLTQSNTPKLLLYGRPGMLMNKKALRWADANLVNFQTHYLGKAKHLMEEDLPHEIGKSLRSWYLNLAATSPL